MSYHKKLEIMEKNFLRDVAKICHVEAGEIENLSQRELVKSFILPRAVHESGQDVRGWRIGSDFMQFMAGKKSRAGGTGTIQNGNMLGFS